MSKIIANSAEISNSVPSLFSAEISKSGSSLVSPEISNPLLKYALLATLVAGIAGQGCGTAYRVKVQSPEAGFRADKEVKVVPEKLMLIYSMTEDEKMIIAEKTDDGMILEMLSTDQNKSVRLAVLKNPNVTESILSVIEVDEDMLRVIIANSKSSRENLDAIYALVKDQKVPCPRLVSIGQEYCDQRFDLEFATNPNSSSEILLDLTRSEYSQIRALVVLNPNVSNLILVLLSEDSDPVVQNALIYRTANDIEKARIAMTTELVDFINVIIFTNLSPEIMIALTKNPIVSEELLTKIALNSSDTGVRESAEKELTVRKEAEIKKISEEEKELKDREEAELKEISEMSVEDKLIMIEESKFLRSDVVKLFLTDDSVDVRRAILKDNRCFDLATLEQIVEGDTDAEVRKLAKEMLNLRQLNDLQKNRKQ